MARPSNRLPLLPIERALKVISGRWKAVILYHLLDGPRRLSELTRQFPDISQKVLVQQLRDLEAHGLVHREVYRQIPPRVDYSATSLGLSLEPVMVALCKWGQYHAKELNEHDPSRDCILRPARRAQKAANAAHALSASSFSSGGR